MTLPLADFTAFHVLGITLGAWAVIVSVLGARAAEFPRSKGAARAVMAITGLLVASTIGAAIATGEKHGEHVGGHGDKANPTHQGESPENAPNE